MAIVDVVLRYIPTYKSQDVELLSAVDGSVFSLTDIHVTRVPIVCILGNVVICLSIEHERVSIFPYT